MVVGYENVDRSFLNSFLLSPGNNSIDDKFSERQELSYNILIDGFYIEKQQLL